MQRRLVAFWPALITLAMSLSVGACSSDNGGEGDFDKALQDYDAAIAPEAHAYAEAAATGHLAALSQVGETGVHKNSTQAVLAAMKAIESRVTPAVQAICVHAGPLEEKAGNDAERLTNLKRLSDSVLIDALATALLAKVLAGPADKRDTFLDLLGVQATSPNNEPLRGIAALQAVNLVDASGQFVIPKRGTDAHDEYVSWLRNQATGLRSTIDGLTGSLRDEIDPCPS
jgi:hypothetical protein